MGSGNTTYTTVSHTPDGTASETTSATPPAIIAGADATAFQRRWIIERDVSRSPGVRRMTVPRYAARLDRSERSFIPNEYGATVIAIAKDLATTSLGKTRFGRGHSGFTLIELMVAMIVFLIISGVAFSLLQQHLPLYNQQQNQSALNISLRNAVAQMQVDVVNAGSGILPGASMFRRSRVGVTVTNAAGGAGCHPAGTIPYAAGCFDTLNVLSSDPNTPPAPPDNGASGCANTTTGSLYLLPVAPTTAAALAADYKQNDQVLLIQGSGAKMTSVVLTQAPTTAVTAEGAEVKLSFNANVQRRMALILQPTIRSLFPSLRIIALVR